MLSLRRIHNTMSSRILIVDDEPANILLLESILFDVADETLGVTDSKAVEQAFIDFMPDLVLLDLHMPEPDGFEIMQRLQRIRESQDFIPVIVLTADDSDLARMSALDLGADDFLTKPLDRKEVVSRVRKLLHTRHLYLGTHSVERQTQNPED
jgi:putative two-component system response regulator